jgi:hypothetical protein
LCFRILPCALSLTALLVLPGCGDDPTATVDEAQVGRVLDEGDEPPERGMGSMTMTDDAMAKQLADASGIAVDEGRIKQQQAKFIELASEFQRVTGRTLQGTTLSSGEAAILRTMLSREKDVSTQGLLQEILNTKSEIEELHGRIDALKEDLPTPQTVKRGDGHLKMAIDWLVAQHNLEAKEADRLARRSLLTDQLAPGMEVWHFYADGVYGTTVSQGSAKVSPYFLNVHKMRTVERERDEAIQLAASLEAEIVVLEKTRDSLRRDLARTQQEKREVEIRNEDLVVENTDLITESESVYFHIDTRRRLREQDVITPIGIRLKDWREDLFQDKMDLRYDYEIEVAARDFGVPRINGVKLLPSGMFHEGRDYSVSLGEGKKTARITLENISKFKNSAFVVVLK